MVKKQKLFADKILFKEFWDWQKNGNLTVNSDKRFEKEVKNYENDTGWFKEREISLYKFLSKRSVKLETRITKNEIEKIVRRHIPFSTIKSWDGNELIIDVDVVQLKREMINQSQIFTFRKVFPNVQSDYTICPVIKEDADRYFLLIQ